MSGILKPRSTMR